MVGRLIAWIFLLLALVAAGRDGLHFLETGIYSAITLGEVWYAVDHGSLNLTQAAIARYLHPFLWQGLLLPLLIWPAWAVLAGAAVIFGLLFGRRSRRKWRSGSLG
jgi:hypothetical protein